jgi:hypothetical protein
MCILCYAFEVPYSRQYEKSIPKVLFDWKYCLKPPDADFLRLAGFRKRPWR